MQIESIDVYQVDLPYSGGVYHLSGGRTYSEFDATIVRLHDRRRSGRVGRVDAVRSELRRRSRARRPGRYRRDGGRGTRLRPSSGRSRERDDGPVVSGAQSREDRDRRGVLGSVRKSDRHAGVRPPWAAARIRVSPSSPRSTPMTRKRCASGLPNTVTEDTRATRSRSVHRDRKAVLVWTQLASSER